MTTSDNKFMRGYTSHQQGLLIDLASVAQNLSENMARLARVAREAAVTGVVPGGRINSLGEVQTQGPVVDRLCIEIMSRQRLIDDLAMEFPLLGDDLSDDEETK